ncbi:LysR family transcriptional regulator [Microlunatus elymi]|uniref:LysR family transcriptional regulator n=1 Tax=Microlunatus elymi TaxID=2596828 RepID=A0A516Q1N9_9ACTN|nr:LysR substrate-binding domain-containing protein [Microlunatus elymi]QDP97318.1 LysR family transcriptional regulator [Microlunatus elymi]
MDLDLRKLRYFRAVAEFGHFGRAAEQLFIAQPVLSRQIRALERELGCELLARTTRSVKLTPAGEQLFADSAGVLAAADSATRRAHEVARGLTRLVVGFAPGLRVSGAVRAFAEVAPEVEIRLLHLNWYDQAEAVRDGRADVGYLRQPFDPDGLRTVPVGSDPTVVCLPAQHRLAGRRRLKSNELAGELILDPAARRFATIEEKLELIAAGEGIAILPRSVARYYARPGIVHRSVVDIDPLPTVLAIATDRRQQHLQDFLDVAADTLS